MHDNGGFFMKNVEKITREHSVFERMSFFMTKYMCMRVLKRTVNLPGEWEWGGYSKYKHYAQGTGNLALFRTDEIDGAKHI